MTRFLPENEHILVRTTEGRTSIVEPCLIKLEFLNQNLSWALFNGRHMSTFLLVPRVTKIQTFEGGHGKFHETQQGAVRPLRSLGINVRVWVLRGFPFCSLSDSHWVSQAGQILSNTCKLWNGWGAGVLSPKGVLISFWMERHFFFISKDIC